LKINKSISLLLIIISIVTINVAFVGQASAKVWTINDTDNGMLTDTYIQNIIDNTQAGDTILFTGHQYGMIMLSIDKPLNIVSNSGTELYACDMNAPKGSDAVTVFALYNGASGTNITGFNINNNNYEGYGVDINNTTNINLSNNNITCINEIDVNIAGSNNITLNNNTLYSSNSGIELTNSNSTNISNNLLTNNNNGILIGNNVSNTLVGYNNISSNINNGVNILNSCNNVTITENYITENYDPNTYDGCGVYINNTINGLNITNNFIYENGNYGICNDLGVTNLIEGTENINNDYITGDLNGDVVRNVYDENGDIVDAPVWIGETCFGGAKNLDPIAVLSGETIMSKIQQISSGIYTVSFVDNNTGLTSPGFGPFYITFFLNKNNTNVSSPEAGDIWQQVLVKNGTAVVNFSNYTYKTTNNSIFAIAPYTNFSSAMKDIYAVNDSDIPKFNLVTYLSESVSTIKNGESVIYKLTVVNNNNKDAIGIKANNILSSEYYNSIAIPSQGSYSNGVWDIGTIKSGQSITLTVTAVAKKSGITSSKAQITGSNINTIYSNTVQTNLKPYIKLSTSNSVSSFYVKVDKSVKLETKVSDTGKDISNNVTVKMTLSKGMKLISKNNPQNYNKSTNTWTFKIAAEKSYTFVTTAQITSKGNHEVIFTSNGKKQVTNIVGY
jgi:hypothetical protein